MLIKIEHPYPVRPTEITPEGVYFDRRQLLRIGVAAAGLALAGCSPEGPSDDSGPTRSPLPAL